MRMKFCINSPLVKLECIRRPTKSRIEQFALLFSNKKRSNIRMFKNNAHRFLSEEKGTKVSRDSEKNENYENRLEHSLPDGYSFTESCSSSFDEHMFDESSDCTEKKVLKDFAQMTISPISIEKSSPSNEDDIMSNEIGEIEKVITPLGLVTIKASTQGQVLKINTKVYIRSPTDFGRNTTTFILLGYIEDVFGTIGDVMYSVLMSPELLNLEIVEKTVYILGNNQNMAFLYVHCKDENKYFISSGKRNINSV